MWLLIPEGFYSIVQKRGEDGLCVRSRSRDDLERFRTAYAPDLGEITETPQNDYRYRARIGHEQFAEALAAVGRGIGYDNFKSEVGRRDRERAHVYSDVWDTLGSIQPGRPYGG